MTPVNDSFYRIGMSKKVPYGEYIPVMRLLPANRKVSSATGEFGVESFEDHPWDYAVRRYTLAGMGERSRGGQRTHQGRVCDIGSVLGYI